MSIMSASSMAGLVLVATLISNYIVSQFLRNSVGVIAPDLAEQLALSAAEIGLLSSVYFFAFAAVQIPIGMALDRFGPRACLVVGAAITVIGGVVFATAVTPGILILGRALMGVGTAGALVCSLAVYVRGFPAQRFAMLTGLQVGIGTIGTLIATAPLAFSTATIGWRNSFLAVAAFTLLAGLLIAVVVPGNAQPAGGRRETLRQSLSGIAAVLRTPSIGGLFAMNLVSYSSFALIVGLWGGPYLAHIYGMSLEQRGNLLLVPVLTQIVGSMLWGLLDRIAAGYRLPVLAGAGATAAALGFLALAGTLTTVGLVIWLALFGLIAAYGPVLIAHGKSLFPSHQVGRGLTVLNMGSMGGTFLAQAISGYVIGLFPMAPDGGYALIAYRCLFGVQALVILLACFLYFRATEDGEASAGR